MRLLVSAFLAIATAITLNALYLQEGPRLAASPAGAPSRSETPPAPKAPAKPAVTASLPDTQSAPAPETALAVQSPPKPSETHPTPLVKSIQKKLAQFGHKALPQDGLANRETRAAIIAVEFEQGLPLTGEPGESVLKALYFLDAAGRRQLPAADRFERDANLVEQVQDILAKLGYTSGPINGRMDAKTREAIKRFEADRRLKPAGRVSERVLLEMVIERGRPFSAKG